LADIDGRVKRTFVSPDPASLAQGRHDYKANPGAALKSLRSAHFRDDEARLSYALGVFREQLGLAPGSDELFAVLRDYELTVKTRASDLIVHDPPTASERRKLGGLLEERESELYELYLAEVERERQTLLLVNGTGVYSGAHDVSIFQQFIGGPVEDLGRAMIDKAPAAFSMLLDFVPIVGQLKGLIEGIVGEDLITGEELATWQRGLGILLAVIPEAKGIFSAGKAGVRALAKATAKAGQSAQQVWRVAKVASRLSAAEIRSAMSVADAAGRHRVARALAEMAGEEGAAAARPLRPLAEASSALGGLPTVGVTLGGQSHKILFGRIGPRVGVMLCSECGLLIDKAATMLNKLDRGHPLRTDLKNLMKVASAADTWVGKAIRAGGSRAAQAQQELQELAAILRDIERRYPTELLREVAAGVPSGDEVTRVDPFPLGATREARSGVEIHSSEAAPEASGFIPEKPAPSTPTAPKSAVPKHEPSVVVEESLPSETNFADDIPTAEIKLTPDHALVKNVVGQARKETAKMLDQVGGRRGAPHGAEHLSPECMMGWCGFGRKVVARELKDSGVATSKIFMNQVADIAGAGRHTFTVVEIAPRRYILIDTTFAQFTGTLRGAPQLGEEILTKSGKVGHYLRKELIEKGYVTLTDEVANVYVKVVSEVAKGTYTVAHLVREEASLARNLELLDHL
jgi:hypothetical protein